MKHKWLQFAILAAVVAAAAIAISLSATNSYYRGVYETCVMQNTVNGQATSFDLLACAELERHARMERWHDQRLPAFGDRP
jgi:hypothetical protein